MVKREGERKRKPLLEQEGRAIIHVH